MNRLLPLSLFAALAACSSASADVASTARDSAGIRIVESTAPAWKKGNGWRISAEPQVVIGGDEADANSQFATITSVVRLGGGEIAVTDAQVGELRLFDPSGRYLRTLARKGGGPGEILGFPKLFLMRGDSLAVWDQMLGRLSVFAPDGAFSRATTVRPGGRFVPRLDGIFPDGSLLVNDEMTLVMSSSKAAKRDSAWLFRYSPDASRHDTVVRYAGAETITISGKENGGWTTRGPVPFGAESFRQVHGDRVFFADNARAEVALRDPTGRVLRIYRSTGVRPVPLTEEEVRAHKAAQLEVVEPHFRMMQEKLNEAMPYPKTRSAFDDVRVDRAGHVWIAGHAAPGGTTVPWNVLDGEGRWLGEVAVPEGLRVMEIGDDYLLGVGKDEVDVQRVELYRLEKPTGD